MEVVISITVRCVGSVRVIALIGIVTFGFIFIDDDVGAVADGIQHVPVERMQDAVKVQEQEQRIVGLFSFDDDLHLGALR